MNLAFNNRIQIFLALLIIAAAIWLPRGLKLDQFVTVDESKWLVRSANFYEALANGRYQHAFQHGHPGVTIMWAGTLGYLLKFPAHPQITPGQFSWSDDSFDRYLTENGLTSLEMLATGRLFVVLISTLVLVVAFVYARRLLGWIPALLGFGLIAFSPFQVALSRVLHPDSLLSTFMLLAALAYLAYLYCGRRWFDLVVSGVAAALAILTKTPGIFLFPLVGLFALVEGATYVWNQQKDTRNWSAKLGAFLHWRSLGRMVVPLLGWIGIALICYFLLWPALWVAPQATLAEVMDISGDYAEQGHSSPVFFAGRIINGDPGLWFYPITYLWRTTPIVLAGLLLCAGAYILRGELVASRRSRATALGMAFFVFFFVVFMNLGAKKFDRYLLPIYMPLDLLAGIGWAAAIWWLASTRRQDRWMPYATAGLATLALAGQALFALPTFPYYMSYYNPLMGGADKAPDVMFIGWGEGLDRAARYLNETVDVDTTHVASWYPQGPFSYFYAGLTDSNRATWTADYSVIYAHQWQRELPSRRMMSYFSRLAPEATFTINDLEYARVYDMHQAPYPDYTVDFGDVIRLVYYDTFSGAMYPGQKYDMTIYFVKLAEMDVNYNILVRLVDQDGHELLRHEGWPDGYATAKWDMEEILRDNSIEVEITPDTPPGLYRIEVSFYDPATFDHLPVSSANTGELLPQPYVLDYLIVGDLPEKPQNPVDPPADLGGKVVLFGADLLDGAGQPVANDRFTYKPGDPVDLRLFWQTKDFMYLDYTTLVHLLGPDGEIVDQADQRPLQGFLPTSYWSPNQIFADDYTLTIPGDGPPGEYQVRVGLYDLETLDRLPITRGGEPAGDAIVPITLPVTVQGSVANR